MLISDWSSDVCSSDLSTRDDDMSKKPLEAALQDQLNKLASLPDDPIDTVDTHETSPEAWLHASRPGLYKPVKQPVTLRLDADLLTWIKEHAVGQLRVASLWARVCNNGVIPGGT